MPNLERRKISSRLRPVMSFELASTWAPTYSSWRHGGWYVTNIHYPNGGVGCVSNNYEDKRWRIVCMHENQITFPSRDAAARAEFILVATLWAAQKEREAA